VLGFGEVGMGVMRVDFTNWFECIGPDFLALAQTIFMRSNAVYS
jgi:hypothetical protein